MLHDPIPCDHPSSSEDDAIGAAEIGELRKEFAGEGIGGLVEIFREEGPSAIARIAAAIAKADADAVRRGAHELKGACANFGARPLEAICQEMESAARGGNIASAGSLLAQIRFEFQRVQAALEKEASHQLPS